MWTLRLYPDTYTASKILKIQKGRIDTNLMRTVSLRRGAESRKNKKIATASVKTYDLKNSSEANTQMLP